MCGVPGTWSGKLQRWANCRNRSYFCGKHLYTGRRPSYFGERSSPPRSDARPRSETRLGITLMSRDAAPASPRQGSYARIISIGVLSAYAVIVILGVFLWRIEAARDVFSGPILVAASFLASAMCFVAWRSLAAPDRKS